MTLGIMQPYFFPYLGYFSLIKNTDRWIVFDTAQYINRGWVNRNRILSQSVEGFSYITVPVVNQPRETSIKNTLIDNSKNWKSKILGQLNYYKKSAPFFVDTKNLVEEVFSYTLSNLSELNIIALISVCNYLEIKFNYSVLSKDNLEINNVQLPDEWALEISKVVGAHTYINAPGGKTFFDKNKYESAGIRLMFLTQKLKPYKTFPNVFCPGLSILDVMMFNSPEEINKMMDDYELE